MIRTEAALLPRGLAHVVSRGTSSHDRNMQSIPEFLTSQYDKSKSPGLNQGLAGKNRMKIKTSAFSCFLHRNNKNKKKTKITMKVLLVDVTS